jgi:hypothetical protein
MKVLDAAIRTLAAKEASQLVQLEKKAPGLDLPEVPHRALA